MVLLILASEQPAQFWQVSIKLKCHCYVPGCDGVCDWICIEGGQGSGVVTDDHGVVGKDFYGVSSRV